MSLQIRLKIAAGLVFFCPLSVLAGSQAEGSMQGMKMYVFDQQDNNAADSPLSTKTIQGSGAARNLTMVVFDGGGATAPVPVDHGRTIGIPANQQAPVMLDKALKQPPQVADMQINSYVDTGYRHDKLKWNKAAPGGTPNILSELQWNNVQSAVITGGTDITFAKNWQVDGKVSYGHVVSGQNQDSDYFLNNRQGEFSRSNNAANNGMSVDASGDLGYNLTLGDKNSAPSWRFNPKLGYAFHTQQFKMTQGVQTIPAYGSFSGLDSFYEGTWYGLWGGLTTQLAFTKRFSLQAGIEYHYVDYEGTGHWNLRGDLQQPISFKHKADGDGIVATAVARYMLTPDWIIRLSADYQGWLANRNGKDTMLFSDGSTAEMKFNEVKWQSYGINLGVEYVF